MVVVGVGVWGGVGWQLLQLSLSLVLCRHRLIRFSESALTVCLV